ncbi:MAG: ABC transporter ATP-binding protein [Erysipelotrichaceae bacterium]|nr:ABC transporter ATP-binding protein [Erysipelotrichaceae bacterium]MDY3659438.1 ABC transporter ATP-binding protein [Bulleidia sp.]
MKTEIKIENISKSFDTQQVLDHITMDFQRGYIHLLNGNNGCGKSTLLKIMYGLMIPDEGTVYWNAKDIEKSRNEYLNHIGIVTADDRSLYHKLSAYENLYYIGRIQNIPKKELDKRIVSLLDRLHLKNDKTLVENFSTGMKKKVMVARAFLNNPDIIFADEVMNGLDKDTCMIVEDMLQEHVQNGNTVFLVSHTGIHNTNHVKNYLIEEGKIKNVESFEEISEG